MNQTDSLIDNLFQNVTTFEFFRSILPTSTAVKRDDIITISL